MVQEGRSKAANIKGVERPLPPRSPHQTTGGERKKVQPIFFRGTFTYSLNQRYIHIFTQSEVLSHIHSIFQFTLVPFNIWK
jgi:hypothetical protein